jgi:16S rRNA G966 N2-methylase RsmD
VTFVEREPRALRAIEKNLEALGYASDPAAQPRYRIVRSDAESWAELHGRAPVDVILADPPYEWSNWRLLFERCRAGHMLVEHGHPLEVAGDYEVSRQYRYGGTLVTLVRSRPNSAADLLEPESSDEDSL